MINILSKINVDFLHLLSSNLFVRAVSFFGQLAIVFILSPEIVASVKTATVYIDILVNLAVFGFTASILKVNSKQHESMNKNDTAIIFFVVSLLSLLISTALYFFSYTDFIAKIELTKSAIQYLSLTILPISLIAVLSATLQSRNEFKIIANTQIITKLLSIFSLLILSYMYNYYGYIVGVYFSHIFTFAILLWCSRSHISLLSFSSLFCNLSSFYKRHFYHAFFSCIAYLMSILSRFMPLIIMNILGLPVTDIGIFSIALTIVMVLDILSSTFQQYVTPKLAHEADNKSSFELLYKKFSIYFSLSILVVGIMVTLFAYILEYRLLNSGYQFLTLNVGILSIAWVLQSMYYLKGPALLVLGKAHINTYLSTIGCIFSIPICYITITYFDFGYLYSRIIMAFLLFVGYHVVYNKVAK